MLANTHKISIYKVFEVWNRADCHLFATLILKNTLTVENRVIFMRRYWFSDSCKDIAEFVGLSEKNVSVRLTRIRQKMKDYLIEREVFV